jgi:hypothetical protein
MTLRHTTFSRTPLDEWSVRRGELYLTKQRSKVTDIHAPGGIRTRNPSKRSASELSLIPRGHRDRLLAKLTVSRKLENFHCFVLIINGMYCVHSVSRAEGGRNTLKFILWNHRGVISCWEHNMKICSNEMNTGRKVRTGFLGSKYGPVGGCLDHSNQHFGSMTVRCFLTTWQSVYQEWTRSVTGLRTLHEHRSDLSTGVGSYLNLTIRKIATFDSAVLTLNTDSFHTSWFSQK